MFSCNSFKILDIILIFLIHFELIFGQSERYGSVFSLLHVDVQLAPFVEEAMYVLGSFVKFQMTVTVGAYFWVFYSVPLFFVSVFVLVPCCFC
jgi:hypothetical protein